MNNYFTPSMASRLTQLEQQFNPIYQPSYNNKVVNNNVIYSLVSGIEGCKMFSLPPGRVGLLFDDVKTVANKLDFDFDKKPYTPEELRTAMHIRYYDNAVPLKKSGVTLENTGWGRLGDFFFTGDDEKNDKLVNYFFEKID